VIFLWVKKYLQTLTTTKTVLTMPQQTRRGRIRSETAYVLILKPGEGEDSRGNSNTLYCIGNSWNREEGGCGMGVMGCRSEAETE
jgi:hypothetical protein